MADSGAYSVNFRPDFIPVPAGQGSLFRTWVTELSYKKWIEFKRLVEPVVTNLKIARDWGRENGFAIDKTGQINRQFTPILKNIPQIHALIIANSMGQSYFLRYTGDGWHSRWNDPQARPGKALCFNWPDGGSADDGKFTASDYDARQRPWFKGALQLNDDEDIFWTTPYSFFLTVRSGLRPLCAGAAGMPPGPARRMESGQRPSPT